MFPHLMTMHQHPVLTKALEACVLQGCLSLHGFSAGLSGL